MADMASEPDREMETEDLYQPFPPAVPARLAEVFGGVLSIFMPVAVVLAPLPALSVAEPETFRPVPSVEMVASGVQVATPERGSLQVK